MEQMHDELVTVFDPDSILQRTVRPVVELRVWTEGTRLALEQALSRRGATVAAAGVRGPGVDVIVAESCDGCLAATALIQRLRAECRVPPEVVLIGVRPAKKSVDYLRASGAFAVFTSPLRVSEVVSAAFAGAAQHKMVSSLGSPPAMQAPLLDSIRATLAEKFGLSADFVVTAELVLMGLQNKEIAALLNLRSPAAAKARVRTLCRRLGVRTRYGVFRAYLEAAGQDPTTRLRAIATLARPTLSGDESRIDLRRTTEQS